MEKENHPPQRPLTQQLSSIALPRAAIATSKRWGLLRLALTRRASLHFRSSVVVHSKVLLGDIDFVIKGSRRRWAGPKRARAKKSYDRSVYHGIPPALSALGGLEVVISNNPSSYFLLGPPTRWFWIGRVFFKFDHDPRKCTAIPPLSAVLIKTSWFVVTCSFHGLDSPPLTIGYSVESQIGYSQSQSQLCIFWAFQPSWWPESSSPWSK